jgi:hypothetical protein
MWNQVYIWNMYKLITNVNGYGNVLWATEVPVSIPSVEGKSAQITSMDQIDPPMWGITVILFPYIKLPSTNKVH